MRSDGFAYLAIFLYGSDPVENFFSQDLRGFDGPHLVDFFPVGMIWRFCLLGLIL